MFFQHKQECPTSGLEMQFLKKDKNYLFKISIGGFYNMRITINHVTLITSMIKVDDYRAEAY